MTAWRRLRHDEGSTITEAMIALGVVWFALVGLMTTMLLATNDVGLGRQRQAATGIANQALENVRSLAYSNVQRGLKRDDPEFLEDKAIKLCSGEFLFRSCDGEKIVSTPKLPALEPLVPHRVTPPPSPGMPTSFVRHVYVTEARGVSESGAYRVTVVITWPPLRGRPESIEVETLVYAPVGCVDPSTHPFSAPCSPFFYATGSVPAAVVDFEGTVDGQQVKSRIRSKSLRTDLQVEQLARAHASAVASGARLDTTGHLAGGEIADRSVDDDPATTAPAGLTSLTDGGVSSSCPGCSGDTTTRFESSAGNLWRSTSIGEPATTDRDKGSAVAALQAGRDHDCPDGDGAPGSASDELPCSYARVAPGVLQRQILQMEKIGNSSGTDNIRMASLHPGPSGSTPAASELLAKSLLQAGSDGRIRQEGKRNLGLVRLGGLPKGAKPTGWTGPNRFLEVSGYAATVSAEAGEGAADPSAVIESGSLSYWNGKEYIVQSLGPTPVTIQVCGEPDAHEEHCVAEVRYTVPAFEVEVETIIVSITEIVLVAGGTSTSQVHHPDPMQSTTVTSAEAVAHSVRGEFRFQIARERTGGDPETVVDLRVNFDLGSTVARTSYREANLAP